MTTPTVHKNPQIQINIIRVIKQKKKKKKKIWLQKDLGLWNGPTLLAYSGTGSPTLYLWSEPSDQTAGNAEQNNSKTTTCHPPPLAILIVNSFRLKEGVYCKQRERSCRERERRSSDLDLNLYTRPDKSWLNEMWVHANLRARGLKTS